MIVREILKDPVGVLATFDYYNDYKDTRSWLRAGGHLHLLCSLDIGNKVWFKKNEEIKALSKHDELLSGIETRISRASEGMECGDPSYQHLVDALTIIAKAKENA